MLRLNVYCSPILSPREPKIGSGCSSWIIHYNRNQILSGRITTRALKDETNGGKNGLPGRSWDPGLEIEVPYEQRPVNEYSSLKDSALYSWAELGPGSFFLRLGGLWLATFIVLGVPIAAASFNPSKDPLRFVLAAGTGTLFLVSLIVLRIYLVRTLWVHELCGIWPAFLAKDFLSFELFENIPSNCFICVYTVMQSRDIGPNIFCPNKASFTNEKGSEFLLKNYRSVLISFIANIS